MSEKPLTAQEKAKAKEIFEALDGDGDGKIDHDDLKTALNSAGFKLTDDEVAHVLSLADADNSGTVTWSEFLKVVEKRPIKKRVEAALRKLFEALDADGSGFITLDDLKKLVKEAGFEDDVSDEELKQFFETLDQGGDGKVSFEEFLALFMG